MSLSLMEPIKAYIIPRPDGAPELQAACNDEAHPLNELVASNFLCQSATSSQQVEAINNLDPNDALAVTKFLHQQLLFTYDESITPFPIPSDIIDACDMRSFENEVELEALCEVEEQRLSGGIEIGIIYSGPAAEQLVSRLNELYGIEN